MSVDAGVNSRAVLAGFGATGESVEAFMNSRILEAGLGCIIKL